MLTLESEEQPQKQQSLMDDTLHGITNSERPVQCENDSLPKEYKLVDKLILDKL